METYSDGTDLNLKARKGNQILFATVCLSTAIQFLMAYIGIFNVSALLWGVQLTILLVPVIGMIIFQVDIKKELKLKRVSFFTVIFAFLAVICAFPTISLLNVISMFFVENAVQGVALELYSHGYIFSLITLGLLPAVGEEFLMRGVIYRSYRKKSPILAWILSAFIFGLFHMNFNQMPYAVFLGIIFVLMVEASDSLITSMCMHFFVNGLSTTANYFAVKNLSAAASQGVEGAIGSGTEMMATLITLIVMVCLTLPLLILIIWAVFRINGRKFSEVFKNRASSEVGYTLPEVAEKEQILDVWFILSVLIMLIITILNTVL